MSVSVSTDRVTVCSKYVLNGTAAFLLELTEMNTCNRFEKYKYAEIENILADPDRALSLSLSLSSLHYYGTPLPSILTKIICPFSCLKILPILWLIFLRYLSYYINASTRDLITEHYSGFEGVCSYVFSQTTNWLRLDQMCHNSHKIIRVKILK